MRGIAPLLLLFCVSCIGQNSSSVTPDFLDKTLHQQLTEIYQHGQLPGFAVAIVNADTILFEQSFGYADLVSKTPYTTRTQQNIASLSKTFIGIALMQVMEQGKLSLDTPINDILPFEVVHPAYPTIPITVQHLATHTSGIDDYEIEYRSVFLQETPTIDKRAVGKKTVRFFSEWAKNEDTSLGDFLAATLTARGGHYHKNRFSKTKPGGQYQYSNVGAALLAYVIEVVAQQPFKKYVQMNVLQPLGMQQTRWSLSELTNTQQATPYFQNGDIVPSYQSILYPAGGLHSTVHDLSLYLISMLKNNRSTGGLLSNSSFQEMIRPQLTPDQSPVSSTTNQALMWELNGQQVGHNGGNYGVTLFMAFDKDEPYGRIFMTNISSYKNQKLLPQMVTIWKLLDKQSLAKG